MKKYRIQWMSKISKQTGIGDAYESYAFAAGVAYNLRNEFWDMDYRVQSLKGTDDFGREIWQ